MNGGHVAAIQALLTAKANPEAMNKFGLTPMLIAKQKNNAAVQELLTKAGARA